ncbi:hypothetical protein BGX33_002541, partial [Mortierella sp. NVP41]
MASSTQEKHTSHSPLPTPSAKKPRLEGPPHPQSEQVTESLELIQTAINTEDHPIFNGFATLQHGPLEMFVSQYQLSAPQSSTFLARVQTVPDTEHNLHRLKNLRLSKRNNALYVPPLVKPTLQSSDDILFPLMEKAL